MKITALLRLLPLAALTLYPHWAQSFDDLPGAQLPINSLRSLNFVSDFELNGINQTAAAQEVIIKELEKDLAALRKRLAEQQQQTEQSEEDLHKTRTDLTTATEQIAANEEQLLTLSAEKAALTVQLASVATVKRTDQKAQAGQKQMRLQESSLLRTEPQTTPEPAEELTALKNVVNRWGEAWSQQNVHAYLAFYAADFQQREPEAVRRGENVAARA